MTNLRYLRFAKFRGSGEHLLERYENDGILGSEPGGVQDTIPIPLLEGYAEEYEHPLLKSLNQLEPGGHWYPLEGTQRGQISPNLIAITHLGKLRYAKNSQHLWRKGTHG